MPTLIRSPILAYPGRQRLQPARATLEDGDLPDADPVEELERALVGEADLLGQVGVGGEGEGDAGLDAHRGEGGRGIQLADGLAQPGSGELDRDPALRDRLH